MTSVSLKRYAVACYLAAEENFREHPTEVWAADYFLICESRLSRIQSPDLPIVDPALVQSARAIINSTQK